MTDIQTDTILDNFQMQSDKLIVIPIDSKYTQYQGLLDEILQGLNYHNAPGATYKRYKNADTLPIYVELQNKYVEATIALTKELIETNNPLKKLDEIKDSMKYEFVLHLAGHIRLNGEHRLRSRFVRSPAIVANLMKQYVTSMNGSFRGEGQSPGVVSAALKGTHVANGSLLIPLNSVIIHGKPIGNAIGVRVWYARDLSDSFAIPNFKNVPMDEVTDMAEVKLIDPFLTRQEYQQQQKVK